MLYDTLRQFDIVLGSGSPRRKYLLEEMGLEFRVMVNNFLEENWPGGLSKEEIPVYLAELKASHIMEIVPENTLLITADTIVWMENKVINKPEGREGKPDWATKYHIALAPAYYQNYLLGRMMSLQRRDWLDSNAGGLVGRTEAGDFFRDRVFTIGNTMHWNDALAYATGEKLNPDYFAQKFTYAAPLR